MCNFYTSCTRNETDLQFSCKEQIFFFCSLSRITAPRYTIHARKKKNECNELYVGLGGKTCKGFRLRGASPRILFSTRIQDKCSVETFNSNVPETGRRLRVARDRPPRVVDFEVRQKPRRSLFEEIQVHWRSRRTHEIKIWEEGLFFPVRGWRST